MPRKRLRSNGLLPEYVTRFKSQSGTMRYRFRRAGYPGGYFTSLPWTPKFLAEYKAFMSGVVRREQHKKPRYAPGSVNELVTRYLAVPARLGASEVTQQKIRAIIEDFALGCGAKSVKRLTFEVIDEIIAAKVIKTGVGNRTKGGYSAAVSLRRELIRLFDFAQKSGMISQNPARLSERVRIPQEARKGGFHTWTEEEIAQYRGRHPLGTRERLAMELILWTDQRRGDVVKMGPSQIVNGRIPVSQDKTGKALWLPVAPQLLTAINAMPPDQMSPGNYLIKVRGQGPLTKESFGNWFKRACRSADLPHCSAHGLRKATLRRMAELEMANRTMKSVSGHSSDKTLAIYTAAADQLRLADSAIDALAAWELQSGRPIQSPSTT